MKFQSIIILFRWNESKVKFEVRKLSIVLLCGGMQSGDNLKDGQIWQQDVIIVTAGECYCSVNVNSQITGNL